VGEDNTVICRGVTFESQLLQELDDALKNHMQLAVKLRCMGRPVPDFGHRARRIVAKWKKGPEK